MFQTHHMFQNRKTMAHSIGLIMNEFLKILENCSFLISDCSSGVSLTSPCSGGSNFTSHELEAKLNMACYWQRPMNTTLQKCKKTECIFFYRNRFLLQWYLTEHPCASQNSNSQVVKYLSCQLTGKGERRTLVHLDTKIHSASFQCSWGWWKKEGAVKIV